MTVTKIDSRKLDMIFFMAFENDKDLSYPEIKSIAKKYSARSLWYFWDHIKRYRNYIKSL